MYHQNLTLLSVSVTKRCMLKLQEYFGNTETDFQDNYWDWTLFIQSVQCKRLLGRDFKMQDLNISM